MTKQKSPAELAAEASSEDTLSFIRRVKRTTRRRYTPEEKVRIVLERWGPRIASDAFPRPSTRSRDACHPVRAVP